MHLVAAPRGWAVREGGYALADARPLTARGTERWAVVRRPDRLTSAILALHGWASAAIAREVAANAFGRHSATPYLLAPAHPGGEAVYVSLIVLTGSAARLDEFAVGAHVDGRVVQLRLPDGERLHVRVGDLGRGPIVAGRG